MSAALNCQGKRNIMRVIGERMRRARQLRGVSQTELAKMIGTSKSQLSMIEHGKSGSSISTALGVAQALSTSLDYLVGQVEDPTPTRELHQNLGEAVARARDTKLAEAAELRVDDVDFVGINEVVASAGPGTTVLGEQIVGRMKFARTWLREYDLRGDQCQIIRVRGESMEPTLADGAAILVNIESREPKDGKIFVLRRDDDLSVKRLVRDRTVGWLLESDNPDKRAWPTRPFPDDAQLVGEVKWTGRSFA